MFFKPGVNLVQPHHSATPPHNTKKIEVAQLVQALSGTSKTIFGEGPGVAIEPSAKRL